MKHSRSSGYWVRDLETRSQLQKVREKRRVNQKMMNEKRPAEKEITGQWNKKARNLSYGWSILKLLFIKNFRNSFIL